MPNLLSEDEVAAYHDRGYHFPIDALSASEVAEFRRQLEEYEARSGGPIRIARVRGSFKVWRNSFRTISLTRFHMTIKLLSAGAF